MRLKDKVVLITGASRGIGLAISQRYAEEGAHLILTATDSARLLQATHHLGSTAQTVNTITADLRDRQAVTALFNDSVDLHGHVDIVVNNAGVYLGKPFTAYTMDEFDGLMQLNVYSVFQLMQLALQHMQTRHYGKIINIASTAGKWESPNQAAYNASKHAVVGLTRCAALENAHLGVNVNAICPGMVDTDMFQEFQVHADAAGISLDELKSSAVGRIPMGRFLEADEVAHIAVYLGSDESRGMTGQTITISGGMRMG